MKAGDEYQQIVATVVQSLAPGAEVIAGDWVTGPDGRRDRDVTVKGKIGRKNVFILIECKDRRRPLDVGFVDAFDSKCRDLKPDMALLCSNSGFSAQALRKCERVGIAPVTVLKQDDDRIRSMVQQKFVAQFDLHHFVGISLFRFPEGEHTDKTPLDLREVDPHGVTYQGVPLSVWAYDIFDYLTEKFPRRQQFIADFPFHDEAEFQVGPETISVVGIRIAFVSLKRMLEQSAQLNATMGMFDYAQARLDLPPGEAASVYLADDKWTVVSGSDEPQRSNRHRNSSANPLPVEFRYVETTLNVDESFDAEPIHALIRAEEVYPEPDTPVIERITYRTMGMYYRMLRTMHLMK